VWGARPGLGTSVVPVRLGGTVGPSDKVNEMVVEMVVEESPSPDERDRSNGSAARPRDEAGGARKSAARPAGATSGAGRRQSGATSGSAQSRQDREARSGGGRSGDTAGRSRRPGGSDADRRDQRPSRGGERSRETDEEPRVPDPELPESIVPEMLDPGARSRLRTLSKGNAENVARHLVAAGLLVDTDPELAYEHAQAAVRRAGRVDVVREAAALTAYATGRYAEALRELRTVRRLSGVDAHRHVEADCERGLGRPERALQLASAPEAARLPAAEQVELAIVVSGARLDLGEPEAALLALDVPLVRAADDPEVVHRVGAARAAVLDALGRHDEATALRASLGTEVDEDDSVELVDLEEEPV